MSTRVVAGIGAVVTSTAVLMQAPATATTYRYWSYWTGGDTWSYSSRGPGFRTPDDRGVEGWRFVVSPRDGSQAAPPGRPSNYETLCPGAVPPPEGSKRVAVVIDSGPAGIAPIGETPPATSVSCLTVPVGETGLQVLQRAARLRFQTSGLICGIAGFPARECPGSSTDAQAPPREVDPTSRTDATPPPPPEAATPPPRTTGAAPPAPSGPPESDDMPDPTAPAAPSPPATEGIPAAPPSPVPVSLGSSPAQDDAPTTPPAWVAAIGAALIAALLGLAVLARRGRG